MRKGLQEEDMLEQETEGELEEEGSGYDENTFFSCMRLSKKKTTHPKGLFVIHIFTILCMKVCRNDISSSNILKKLMNIAT